MINTNFINVKRHNWIKALFWVKPVKTFSKSKLIMHLNKASLSRFIKSEYSWISHGKSEWIRNTQFKDSIYLISTIASDEWTLTSVWSDTVKSITILNYLNTLVNDINHQIKYNISRMIINTWQLFELSSKASKKLSWIMRIENNIFTFICSWTCYCKAYA